MLRIPWSVNLNRLMYVAMICLLGEFVCAVCAFARSPNNEHARGGAMRATTHTVGPQATFAAPFVGFRFRATSGPSGAAFRNLESRRWIPPLHGVERARMVPRCGDSPLG